MTACVKPHTERKAYSFLDHPSSPYCLTLLYAPLLVLAATCHSNMSGGLSNGQLQVEVDAVMNDAADIGVPVHKFDPDASPEEKAAQAGKARDKLTSVKPQEPKAEGKFSMGFLPSMREGRALVPAAPKE